MKRYKIKKIFISLIIISLVYLFTTKVQKYYVYFSYSKMLFLTQKKIVQQHQKQYNTKDLINLPFGLSIKKTQ